MRCFCAWAAGRALLHRLVGALIASELKATGYVSPRCNNLMLNAGIPAPNFTLRVEDEP